jgi:short-subunit dehydrogenase
VNPGYIQTNISKNSLIGDGKQSFGKTDENIRTGMNVSDCAKEIIEAIHLRKHEVWTSKGILFRIKIFLARLLTSLKERGLYANLKQQRNAIQNSA